MAERYDVIVVGGGFAGVTAARECALRGRRTLLLEARDRLGGRTWSAGWNGFAIEYGGAWVHWHQPHTFSELTRAGLSVAVSGDAGRAHWHVGAERRTGTIAERDAIARRGWDRFVEGVREALPQPHAPLAALAELGALRPADDRRADRASSTSTTRSATCWPPSSSRSRTARSRRRGPCRSCAGTRCPATASSSTQFTGGRVTIDGGHRRAAGGDRRGGADFDRRLATPVAAVASDDGRVEVHTRDGEAFTAGAAIVAVALNALGGIEFSPQLPEDKRRAIELGQASRGIKIMIHARGEDVDSRTRSASAIRSATWTARSWSATGRS